MRIILALFGCLLLVGCTLENIQALTAKPAARFIIYQQSYANSGTQFLCGIDHTGLGISNYYENLAYDALVVGHVTTGADNRCRVDILTRMNAHVAFDLSALFSSRPSSVNRRQITSAVLSATLAQAPGFHGGGVGCRGVSYSSHSGVSMLDHVAGSQTNDFFPIPCLIYPILIQYLRRCNITLQIWRKYRQTCNVIENRN